MAIFLAVLTIVSLWLGWFPTETNHVDTPSMISFIAASFTAWACGLETK